MPGIESEGSKSLDQREHKTLANAKKVLIQTLDASGNYVDFIPGLVPGEDYDYIGVVATSGTVDTLTWKDGGSGGTTVKTLTITYTASDVDKISDTFSTLGWS